MNAAHHARPHLEKTGPGATLTIIGTVSFVEVSGPTSPYRSVKAALVPFAKSLAIDMAPKGVRANVVSPGTILEDGNTWGRQRDAGAERYKRMLARNPSGRMGTPQEVASCVVFLAGSQASFVSGHQLHRRRRHDRTGAVLSASRTPWALVGLLVAAGMVAAFHVGKVPPSIPSIRDTIWAPACARPAGCCRWST